MFPFVGVEQTFGSNAEQTFSPELLRTTLKVCILSIGLVSHEGDNGMTAQLRSRTAYLGGEGVDGGCKDLAPAAPRPIIELEPPIPYRQAR